MRKLQFVRDHFFTGLLVFLPFAVILWLVGAVLKFLNSLHEYLPGFLQPEQLSSLPWVLQLVRPGITFILVAGMVAGLSFLGWASKHYLGMKLLELLSDFIQRIPVIRSIYGSLDQLLRAIAAGGGGQFSRVVYVEYPRKGIWAIAFVTGPSHSPGIPKGHLNLYVPTTPNPTSGFHLIVPESEVQETSLRVEDAFKTILSLGIAQGSAQAPGPGPGR